MKFSSWRGVAIALLTLAVVLVLSLISQLLRFARTGDPEGVSYGLFFLVCIPICVWLAFWSREQAHRASRQSALVRSALNAYQAGRSLNISELASEQQLTIEETIDGIQKAQRRDHLPPDLSLDYSCPTDASKTPEL